MIPAAEEPIHHCSDAVLWDDYAKAMAVVFKHHAQNFHQPGAGLGRDHSEIRASSGRQVIVAVLKPHAEQCEKSACRRYGRPFVNAWRHRLGWAPTG